MLFCHKNHDKTARKSYDLTLWRPSSAAAVALIGTGIILEVVGVIASLMV